MQSSIRSSFQISRSVHLSSVVNMPAKVGDQLPSVDLFEGNPG
ncbi:unnamed protein product, partial [Allacma fusca]